MERLQVEALQMIAGMKVVSFSTPVMAQNMMLNCHRAVHTLPNPMSCLASFLTLCQASKSDKVHNRNHLDNFGLSSFWPLLELGPMCAFVLYVEIVQSIMCRREECDVENVFTSYLHVMSM